MINPKLDVPGPWIAAGTDPEFWRLLRDQFGALHQSETEALQGQREDLRFRVYASFPTHSPYGLWQLWPCPFEWLCRQYDELAVSTGIKLTCPPETNPSDYWLNCIWKCLYANDSAVLKPRTHDGGIITDVFQGSAICCSIFARDLEQYNHLRLSAAVDVQDGSDSLEVIGRSTRDDLITSVSEAHDFETIEGRCAALTAYTTEWSSSEASLARAARVHPSDLSRWKNRGLSPESSKTARIQDALKKNSPPSPAGKRQEQ